jgi:transketolase
MRLAFCRTLVDLAQEDPRIVLLTGDLGYTVLEPFAERYPERFFNVGVAEQNMLGLATGLAEAGFVPFVYSIATFAALRPFEFIRNGPVLHRLPVRIVGVGGGFEYGSAGPTHHAVEDVGVLRTQAALTIIAPADAAQAATALRTTRDIPGPIYYRLGKDDRVVVPGLEARFALGRGETVTAGEDIVLVAMGPIAVEAVAAVASLKQHGVSAAVHVVSTLNPAPTDDLAMVLAGFPAAVTIEAHSVSGGLGSLVAEVIAEHGLPCRLERCGVRAPASGRTGGVAFYHELHGLTADAVARAALRALRAVAV